MTTTDLNWVDYCIIGIFCFSILAGMMRGLVKEVVAVLTWVVAFVIASLFADRLAGPFLQSPKVQAALQSVGTKVGFDPSHSVSMIAVGICFIAIFISVLLVGGVINYFISSALEAAGISIANRLLGGIFGLLRGFLVNFIIIFIVQLSPITGQPVWQSSQFVKAFQPAVLYIYNWLQPNVGTVTSTFNRTVQSIKPVVPTFNAQ